MNKKTRKWTAGAVLALALCGVTVGMSRGADDEDELLNKAIEAAKKVILEKSDGPMDAAAAAMLAKEHKMEATMKLFKPKSKRGVGVGDLTKAGHKDSIELLIRDYTIKSPTKAEVEKYNKELIKAANITAIIAEMTPNWAPIKDSGPKTKAKWLELTKEMKEGAADLVAGAKAKDEKAVETAAKRLNNSCAECHKIFRDDK